MEKIFPYHSSQFILTNDAIILAGGSDEQKMPYADIVSIEFSDIDAKIGLYSKQDSLWVSRGTSDYLDLYQSLRRKVPLLQNMEHHQCL